jgi:transposase
VDTLGLLLAVRVTAASEQERAQVFDLAADVQAATGQAVTLAFVDQGYTGDQPAADAAAHGITLEVIKLAEAKKGFVLLPRRWVVEIVHSQVTKPHLLALGAGREHVADLDPVVRHHDAVHQQLDQLPLPLEGRVPQPRRHPLAERPQRGDETGHPVEPIGLAGEASLLLGQGRGPRLQLAAAAAVLRQRDDAPEVRLGQPVQLPGHGRLPLPQPVPPRLELLRVPRPDHRTAKRIGDGLWVTEQLAQVPPDQFVDRPARDVPRRAGGPVPVPAWRVLPVQT